MLAASESWDIQSLSWIWDGSKDKEVDSMVAKIMVQRETVATRKSDMFNPYKSGAHCSESVKEILLRIIDHNSTAVDTWICC